MNKIYSRLAFTNIKNNKTLYMPYIISGMVMIAMFYVMMFLNNSKGLGLSLIHISEPTRRS